MADVDATARADVTCLRDAGWTLAAIRCRPARCGRAFGPDAGESAAGRPPRRVEPDSDPQSDPLAVVLVLGVAIAIGGWLWEWWRRRTEPDEPTDEARPALAAASMNCRRGNSTS